MFRKTITGCLALSLILTVGTVIGQTITVDTSDDVVDFGGAQQVADLPGPDGKVSLREAGLASDNTPGVQTIAFHIPQSEWLYQNFFPGRAVLRPFLGFRVFDTAIIDGTTQTAFTGETNPDGGAEVVIWASTYIIDNMGGAMLGFDNSSIYVSGGSANLIQGNTQTNIEIYDSPFTLIGGTNPGEGNTCGTIKIDRSSNNVVVGNTTTRVRVLGWVGGGQPATNVRIGGPTLAERNYITGYGTWSSEGYPGGTTLQIFDSIGTIVENNWIGTTPDGLDQGSLASTQGIGFEGENHDAIIRKNRIAGILGHGIGPHYAGWLVGSAIDIYGIGSGITLVGNTIGLNANDQPVLGSVTGIATRNYYLGPVQNVTIGGSAPGDGNQIAGHLLAGVSVANTYSGVRISGNSVHDNGSIGIDLVTPGFQYGVTFNDPLDADTGGNGLQNFPEILAATNNGLAIHVVGQLNSEPLKDYTLEFFASPECDPSGFGEGQMFLGSTSVTTDAAGNAAFDVSLSVMVPGGWVITSTATLEPIGSTSEFSACLPIESQAITQVASDSFNVLRGVFVSGTLADTFDSDDSYLKFKPGITLNSSEPPVWLEFVGTLPNDAPTSLSVTLESQANTLGLTQTIDMFNWNSGQYESVDSRTASFNTDSVATVDLSAGISDYVQAGSGTVKTRMGWRATGPVLLYPWTASIDQVIWSAGQ